VHLPIGGLVLLGVLELLAGFTRWKDAPQNSRVILGFVCATALISALCGLMLEKSGGYEPQLLKWHRAAGLGVAGLLAITLLFRHLEWRCTYRVCLTTTLLLLVIAGHSGGSITHGRAFLTQYAPAPVRALLGEPPPGHPAVEAACPLQERPVFTAIIEPILQERCVACHGAEKHKGELRLDTLSGLLQGGQDGPVVKAGQATDSPLVQSMLSPLDADGHMPPEDHPQPTAEEISLIAWWINEGAPAAAKVVDLKPKPEIQRLFEIVSRRHEPAK
jgi:hypothetical protein